MEHDFELTEDEVQEEDSVEGVVDINSDFEALFARQSQIITDPAVVIAHSLEQLKSSTSPDQQQVETSNSDTLSSDIDTIITLLNRVRNNNNSAHVRVLLRVVLVTDINLCIRLRILDDVGSWGFNQEEIGQLKLSLSHFPVASLKVTIGQPIRHYMIRLSDLQQGALRNNIFYEEFISFFNHQEVSHET
ncbi:TraI [Klebsiella pneumoniae]|nr:TraI [Klebsiella pneumoniae]